MQDGRIAQTNWLRVKKVKELLCREEIFRGMHGQQVPGILPKYKGGIFLCRPFSLKYIENNQR